MECKDFEPSKIQENKILLLCKRLDKFDIDKIETISEMNQSELLPILDELIEENKLTFRNNTYFYLKKVKKPKPKIFEHHSKETVDLIIRCFCSNIPTMQTGNIVGIYDGSVGKFYQYFRECIYNRQELFIMENCVNCQKKVIVM